MILGARVSGFCPEGTKVELGKRHTPHLWGAGYIPGLCRELAKNALFITIYHGLWVHRLISAD